jgi:hypothetical protein
MKREWEQQRPGAVTGDSRERRGSGIGKHTLTEQSHASADPAPAGVVQRRASPGAPSEASAGGVQEAAAAGLRGTPQPLPHVDRIQQLFGAHGVSGIKAHVGGAAAPAAAHMGAMAYATGNAVAFQAAPDLHTAAHEAAHVVQQRSGIQLSGGVGQAGDRYEQHADAVADAVVAGRSAEPLLDGVATPSPTEVPSAGALVQHQEGDGSTDPNAIIPIEDFIGYVEDVERAYLNDSMTDIVTRIRVQYYSGIQFQQLMLGSHTHDIIPAADAGIPAVTRGIDRVGDDAYNHLTAHADENGTGDNPSPYIQLTDGAMVDVGHLLLGLDSLAHPEAGNPYASAGVPGIDPASWVADLGIASVWMTEHEENGTPPSDAPSNRPDLPELDKYYEMSAPDSDLLGDVDSFGMAAVQGPTTLSAAMRAYYLGQEGAAAGMTMRWQIFCRQNGLTFARSGNTITWDGSLAQTLVSRIDVFNNLYATRSSVYEQTLEMLGAAPTARSWPHTPAVVERFLAWMKPLLEAELNTP